MGAKKLDIQVPGREGLSATWDEREGAVENLRLQAVGPRSFLKEVSQFKTKLQGSIDQLPEPEGNSPASLLLRELVLKIQNRWSPPYQEEEICHCRGISLKTVDAAIVAGAHDSRKVSRWTSASTACGTCRPDVESYLRFRLRDEAGTGAGDSTERKARKKAA